MLWTPGRCKDCVGGLGEGPGEALLYLTARWNSAAREAGDHRSLMLRLKMTLGEKQVILVLSSDFTKTKL